MALSVNLHRRIGGRLNPMGARKLEVPCVTIGRGANCTIVLKDPIRYVSRVHVEIEERDGSYWLTVVSKVNPVLVNGNRHGAGSHLNVQPGDRLEIGDYEVEILPPEYEVPKTPLLDVLQSAVRAPEKVSSDPDYANLIASMPQTAAAPVAQPAPQPEPPAPAPKSVAATGEDFEPGIGETAAPSPHVAAAPAAGKGRVFREPTYRGEPLESEAAIFEQETHVPIRSEASPTQQTTPDFERSLERLLHGFLDGAGLPRRELSSPEELEELMRRSGAIVRASVGGIMALLIGRAAARKEFRAEERTMVASRDNNPLKLMSDLAEVMEFLFDTRERSDGFLDPLQAVNDAFDDLRAHEFALIAGMRAAILGAIRRFDPKALEAELAKSTGSLGLIKKAKLWDEFVAYHGKVAADAQDDFNKVFGREFMEAYMMQLRRLRAGK